MKLNDSNSIAGGLDDKNKSSILQLIDLKIEDDMEKILAKMDAKFAHMESKIDSKFAQIDSRFAHVEGSITTVRWVIIVAGGLLGAILTIIATK